eukprot:m.222997 g.222997  ORF g.222997 m.222997 type:complete len:362 (-) comp33388_c3_seq1:117-1202(-)
MLGPLPWLILSWLVGPAPVIDSNSVVEGLPPADLTTRNEPQKTKQNADPKLTPKKRKTCVDGDENCKFWADSGECENNPSYMLQHCKLACGNCAGERAAEMKIVAKAAGAGGDIKNRCAREDADNIPILPRGGVTQVFTRIETDPDINKMFDVTIVSRDPWIATLDNFVSQEESQEMLDSLKEDFERSSSTGKKTDEGTFAKEFNSYRTSFNAWCNNYPCRGTNANKILQKRIADLTLTEVRHQEYFQVLDYSPGQYYKQHHDFIPGQLTMPCGPRVFTAFMYFNEVEEGGHTYFPTLNISVEPKPGRLLLWPHVLDSNMEKMDGRTEHEATAVIKGKKYAANAWVHLYDFQKYNAKGCTG